MGKLRLGKLATNSEEDKSVILRSEFSQTASKINIYEPKIKQNSPTITIRTERP
jgi:hypothetical protein